MTEEVKDQAITIDANAFAAAFMEALPTEISELKTKMTEARDRGAPITQEHFAALDALIDVKNGFCSLWPEANQQLDDVEWWINFWRPNVVAIMNAVEAAINKLIYKPLCGVAPVAGSPAKPKLKSNIKQGR